MIETILDLFTHNRVIQLVAVAVIFDTLFGVIRAIRERAFNSCFGIDGAIRKISMIVSLCGLIIVDYLVHVNLIGFLPDELRGQLGVDQVGTAEFFGFLYIAYEIVSILKNMYLCGTGRQFAALNWKEGQKDEQREAENRRKISDKEQVLQGSKEKNGDRHTDSHNRNRAGNSAGSSGLLEPGICFGMRALYCRLRRKLEGAADTAGKLLQLGGRRIREPESDHN